MSFYKSCLGGELSFQTVGESPLSEDLPSEMKEFILQAHLKNDALVLMATDMVGEGGLHKGNAMAILVECSSEDELSAIYRTLSSGGEATDPIQVTFWGALFGGLTDKYGNRWLLNFNKTRTKK